MTTDPYGDTPFDEADYDQSPDGRFNFSDEQIDRENDEVERVAAHGISAGTIEQLMNSQIIILAALHERLGNMMKHWKERR